MMALEDVPYQPKDAVARTARSTMLTGGAGLFFAAVQNTLRKQNVTAWGVFTKSGGVVATFIGMGASFEFMRTAAANLRQRDDSWNAAFGGLFAGAVLGIRFRTIPAVAGYGLGIAAITGFTDLAGNTIGSYKAGKHEDEFEWKMKMRKDRRRNVQETIDQLGEGRGIYGPGYEVRRAARIKEHYGIDVPVSR